ncbi:MAG: glutamine--tRNA ligase/YqeY domain fusion protein [Candidatus Cloacimonetes bacterium]|jgi:glutaminyl-tRNA synthetase|nr:glutamine--tRNA ligase/YqeY domain fusion protein [Candidatus Cloacimonadota bacterium]MDX9949208.1 glutamine--tRNA ligase/YqeY domain fusion protein [Candidatus Syntrophosphaera sp.]NLN84954.1 glutamine--tRNA ligase/YqeY domain fusion protein [Candidatus Cloacimonadota bacterium]
MENIEKPVVSNFIRTIIDRDLESGKHSKIVTRFPPEPNGYLHIGHAKSICLNFGLARDYGGICHLRFDDTNPIKEDIEYVDSIMEDVRWLGFDWADKLFYASDYFDQLYEYAEMLIHKGLAFVCDLCQEEIREYRGTLTVPGKNSPWRERSIEENLDLFRRMRDGEFEEGEKSLRAKIDMASPNLNMRDPVIYRIKKAEHHRTGTKWVIYPMYDYTHSLSDSIEGITHSLCTLEFEDHRPLYEWFLQNLPVHSFPQQIEFARLNLSYTVMSKRLLLELVKTNVVKGWDDPRMPTIAGMRRRGFPPAAIRDFADRIGVAKASSMVDFELLQFCVREELNQTAKRVMGVLDPIPLIIENYPDDSFEELEAINNPEDSSAGTRMIPFGKELYIEREDFVEDPPKGWFRLSPGAEVRLKHAYYVICKEAIKDEDGNIIKIICSYDPASRGGSTPDKRKVRGTIHWVSAAHAIDAEVRLYEQLFTLADMNEMEEGKSPEDYLNPESLKVLTGCKMEPSLASAEKGERFQLLRQGYFCVDLDSSPQKPVFNRIVTLKDGWARQQRKQ